MSNSSPRPRAKKPPKYCHHKGSGQAYVRLHGVDHYLGKHGSLESLKKYAVMIAEHSAGAVIDNHQRATSNSGLTIAEICLAYVKHSKSYYTKNGQETDEVNCIKSAIRDLIELYGDHPANEFGPLALKAVRQKMTGPKQKKIGRTKKTIEVQWTRRFINMSVGRIRRMFKWAVENELVEPMVLLKLRAVAPLMAGRTEAREHTPRRPVDLEVIKQVKALVPARTADLIDLWLLTGSRPGELVKLTGEMIDRKKYESQGVWIAELKDHKTVHRGKIRVLVFGPKAQLILNRYIVADPSKRLFRLNRASASDAIKKACRQLEIPVFTAHWLRHTAGTRIRGEYGLDASQVTLGHANADMTELYAGIDLSKAVQVARDAG